MHVELVGVVGGADGYGAANRGLYMALQKKATVSLAPLTGMDRFVDDSATAKDEIFLASPKGAADVRLVRCAARLYPSLHTATTKRNALWTVFELQDWPPDWVQGAKLADTLVTSSNFCAEAMRKHGLSPAVVPEGADPVKFQDQHVPRTKFRFVMMGEWNPRKNIQRTVRAFAKTFHRNKDVELLVKAHLPPNISGPDVEGVLRAINKEQAQVLVALGTMRDDAIGPEVYNQTNVFLATSHGEGFNRPALEAMFCSLPVIATGWGGQTDFINDKNGWLLPYELVDVVPFGDYAPGMKWAQPDEKALMDTMRYCVDNPDEVKRRGAQAAKVRETHTWEACVDKLLQVLA